MPATTRRRNEKPLKYEASTTQTVELDRDELYYGVDLRVTGEVNVTVAGTPVTDGPALYVKEIAVKVSGHDIVRLPGIDWYRYAQIFSGRAPSKTDVASGTGVKAWSVILPISFEMLRVLVPAVSLYPAWRYRTALLEVKFGALADLYTGGTATLQTLGGDVQKKVAEEIPGELIAQAHEYVLPRVEQLEKEVTGNSDNFQLDLAVQRAVRAILLSTTDAGVYEDDIITDPLTMKKGSGDVVFGPVGWTTLRERNADLYGIAMPAGFAVIDFAEDRDIGEILDATQIDALTVVAKVVKGAGTTKVFADQIGLQPSGLPAE